VKAPASEQKLRGGYYTPAGIARFLADWAIRRPGDVVLEPSAGDGAFVAAALARLRALGAADPSITAVEIDPDEAAKVRRLPLGASGIVHDGDFFAWAARAFIEGRRYSAILGNPPFLRFQYFLEQNRSIAFRLMELQGLRPNRLTNAWVPFVAVSAALLAPGGRLAMVVPAELLQVTYSAQLRKYLADHFRRVTVFAFDHLVFEEIQQEVVLLTAERSDEGPSGIRVIELRDASELTDGQHDWSSEPLKSLDHDKEKWTQYFLAPDELDAVRHLRGIPSMIRLGEVAEVDVGVVTGMNDFFLMDSNGSTPVDLKRHGMPIVTRSNQLVGAEVTLEDWQSFYDAGQARLLLSLSDDDAIEGRLATYLGSGEEMGIDKGYKCRIRRKWYVVPSRWRPAGFMLRQIHTFPRLALNRTEATSTDTVHRVRFKGAHDPEAVVAAFYSTATFLLAEIFGRSYGGGVLELEPTEAEHLLISPPDHAPSLASIDAALRSSDVDALLSVGDAALRRAAGLGPDELGTLRSAWQRLRDRRLRRNRGRMRRVAAAAGSPG
jgi:adenine-specific DNA-methyltransferase